MEIKEKDLKKVTGGVVADVVKPASDQTHGTMTAENEKTQGSNATKKTSPPTVYPPVEKKKK